MIIRLTAASIVIAVATTVVFAEEEKVLKDSSTKQTQVQVFAFGDVDSNHDMKITEKEFKAKGKNVAKFKKADINKDGLLNKDEFVAYAREKD